MRGLRAPPSGRQALAPAIVAVFAATGLTFIDDGSTDEAASSPRAAYQPDRYGDRWAPVLLAWATPIEVPDFGIDIAGVAGATRIRTPSGDTSCISGALYLDPAKYAEITARSGKSVADSVILRELGPSSALVT